MLGWRTLVLLGGAVVFAGCATAPEKVDSQAAAKLRRIGVVSAVGGEFGRQYTGVTVFGNESERKPIPEWSVDAAYEAQAGRALAELGSFEPVPLKFKREDFAALGSTFWQPGEIKGQRWEAIKDKIKAVCAANIVDALVVVLPRSSEDFLARTNQFFRGAGFYSRGMGDSTMVAVMHLIAHVVVVECTSGDPLASRMLSRFQTGNYGNIARGAPMPQVDAMLARTKVADWNESTGQRIRQELTNLPTEAWRPTLSALLKDH